MAIHTAAATGFERASDAYERGRPDYPQAAIDHLRHALALHRDASVLDLGAGTGKLTKLLLGSAARIIAVEPVAAMRAKLSEVVPQAEVLEGTAEAIPLPAASVDAAVVAQAFHWFDAAKALAELHRVLKPKGRLAIVWNVRDTSEEWVDQLTQIMEPHQGTTPSYRTSRWREAFTSTALFTQLEHQTFRHEHRGPPDMVVDRVASVSFIASLPDHERARVLDQVRALLTAHPTVRGQSEVALPYATEVYVCTRSP
jgi:ubiquinone/menaquinone biosynthesis C-methylase UbiE